ncbi:MAG: hypothetical protein IJ479_06200 [Alphaproteobacteria bacterium]|nr:hypothetical protein [Alphaproteobacteria bacterium]
MKLTFFTFGGGQFWEDVFFYQKWRIQRNLESKKYRLLDPWDIERHRGTFEECRKAFVKFIDVYQLPRQKGPMIVMLHGFAESKNVFRPLWRKALKKGYLVAAINYPSTEKKIDGHVKQLLFMMNHMEDVNEVYFVAKGIGAVILRKLLAVNAPWKERIRIKRIVMVCPANQGSAFITALGKNKLLRWIFGPITEEMSIQKARRIPNLPEGIDCGIIYCAPLLKKIIRFLPDKLAAILPTKDESKLSGVKSMVEIKNGNINVFKNRRVSCAVLNFLGKGRFK